MNGGWGRVDDVVEMLRKRWNRGLYLRSHASGEPWQPVAVPVRAPTAADLADRFDDVIQWNDRFRRDSCTTSGRPRFSIEYRTISGRGLGSNQVPARVRIETLDQLCALLGTHSDVRSLDSLIELTAQQLPALMSWVKANPLVAIAHHEAWSRLLDTVNWIASRDTSTLYLRHVDPAGVDTKFIERHHQLLGQLLTVVLPPGRIDTSKSSFAERFGFRSKPGYTRLRLLSPNPLFPNDITELRLRTDELARCDLGVARVFIVENEASYLAFPTVADAVVLFGEGFQLTTLEAIPWLMAKELVYWGDIDTHGFAILNHLRARFPRVTSILMDQETLLAHRTQLVSEPNPTTALQPHLTQAESALYRDLIEDRFGHAVRLEQERVRYSSLRSALQPWGRLTG